MKVSLGLPDNQMPRTLYYEHFLGALRRNWRFTENDFDADVLFPAEDITLEGNWPRYGNPAGAFVRGQFDEDKFNQYVKRLQEQHGRICIITMHPQVCAPQLFKDRSSFIVADGSLSYWERSLNPRTVSMPALPITVGGQRTRNKDLVASFRGSNTHKCREALASLHDGRRFVCELADPRTYAGRVDATTGAADGRYVELLERSTFAFVPEGDSLFSYRLLEVMSFGCIPIILSDGWLLPFDRSIDWPAAAISLPEAAIPGIPSVLERFSAERIEQMQANLRAIYLRHLANLDVIVETLLGEVEEVINVERADEVARNTDIRFRNTLMGARRPLASKAFNLRSQESP